MKIIQPKNTRKLALIGLISLLVLAAITVSMFHLKIGLFSTENNTSTNLDQPTLEQIKTGNEIKKQAIDQENDKNRGTGSDPTPAPQPVEGSNKKTVNMEITAVNQSDATLQVRTLIQAVVNTGECTLSMKGPQDATYTTTAAIQALASSSTCKGFDIPVDQLKVGKWTLTIDFTNSELTTSTVKDIEIK
jgi:hypothetical protein